MNFLRKQVAVPLWFLIFGAFSLAAALLNRLLLPSVRWFLRSRANRVIRQANERLPLRLPEFKLTRRKELIGRVVYDARVMEAVEAYSREQGLPRDVVMERVEAYANEIVPAFNAYIYFHFGIWLANYISRIFYRVRLGYVDQASLERLSPNDSIVFIMNHRSNIDYLLLGLIAIEQTTLSYAVGEWARPFPIRQLVKAMGGFFVRRESGNPLYRRVLERYVQMATQAGVVQAVFPEGRLTRDGRLQPPRLGLLDYMLRTFDADGPRDLVLVPVAVNYDRVVEDRDMLQLLEGKRRQQPTPWGNLRGSLRFLRRNLPLLASGARYRFGYAVLNVGTPISTRAYARQHGIAFDKLPKEERIAHAQALAAEVMAAIGRIVPVLPVAVAATALCEANGEWLAAEALHARANALLAELGARGAHSYVPRDDRDYTIDAALNALALRRIVEIDGGRYRAAPAERQLLAYYANSIAHLLS